MRLSTLQSHFSAGEDQGGARCSEGGWAAAIDLEAPSRDDLSSALAAQKASLKTSTMRWQSCGRSM